MRYGYLVVSLFRAWVLWDTAYNPRTKLLIVIAPLDGYTTREECQEDAANTRQVQRSHAGNSAQAPLSHQHAQRSAAEGQQDTLNQQLPNETPARGPKRCPHRKFGGAGACARQKKTRHVGARDQQHEGHRAEQRPEQGADVRHQSIP